MGDAQWTSEEATLNFDVGPGGAFSVCVPSVSLTTVADERSLLKLGPDNVRRADHRLHHRSTRLDRADGWPPEHERLLLQHKRAAESELQAWRAALPGAGRVQRDKLVLLPADSKGRRPQVPAHLLLLAAVQPDRLRGIDS